MYQTIVLGYHGGAEARDALALAGWLAGEGSRVIATLVEPFDPGVSRPDLGNWGAYLHAEAQTRLADVDAAALPAGVRLDRHLVPGNSPARGLHDFAEEVGADAIVLGSTRRGTLGRVLLGSTAETLLRSAPCAVAVAPRGLAEHATDRPRVIGVGYDGSPESEVALRTADALARGLGGTLRVVTVVEPPSPPAAGLSYGYGEAALGALEDYARERLDAALERIGPDTRPLGVKRRGDPATVLADEAERGMDLLIVGSRGYGPFRRALLGGVSARLMRFAPCSVVVLPRSATSDTGAEPPAENAVTDTATPTP